MLLPVEIPDKLNSDEDNNPALVVLVDPATVVMVELDGVNPNCVHTSQSPAGNDTLVMLVGVADVRLTPDADCVTI